MFLCFGECQVGACCGCRQNGSCKFRGIILFVVGIASCQQKEQAQREKYILDFTLDFLLEERARELYWEGHRRTDLIRYRRFSETSWLWPWKGGVKEGRSIASHYDHRVVRWIACL